MSVLLAIDIGVKTGLVVVKTRCTLSFQELTIQISPADRQIQMSLLLIIV